MLRFFQDEGPWFRAKKFGYGAGLPFKWQGWAVLGVYLLTFVPLGFISKQDGAAPKIISLALIFVATLFLLVIVRKRTEGGWKRRGDFGA